jgi:hypothetical protein
MEGNAGGDQARRGIHFNLCRLHASMAIALWKLAHIHSCKFLWRQCSRTYANHDTSERTRKHCLVMENCNYGREGSLFLNMCNQGVIGDILHDEAAYGSHTKRYRLLADIYLCPSQWKPKPHTWFGPCITIYESVKVRRQFYTFGFFLISDHWTKKIWSGT